MMGSADERTRDGPAPVREEAGTPPSDRAFRPDIQGLRAVAVALVIAFHFRQAWVPGGYVGVDVFFVVSGFVITGLIMRESTTTGRLSLSRFYARRARRILPAASVTIVVTVVATAMLLGAEAARMAATDGRWAALVVSNVPFAAVGNSYLGSQALPSPLQNFWSLSVEEQFYLAYPAIVIATLWAGRRLGVRRCLNIVLVTLVVGSLALSISQTSTAPVTAFYSAATRAWELSFGALLAVNSVALRRLPRVTGTVAGPAGLSLIGLSAWFFTAGTPYPGSAAILPVVGAGLVIASGSIAPGLGAENLLGSRPLIATGSLSYGLYLWHWPLLILVAERHHRTSVSSTTALLVLAATIAAALVTQVLIENPIRHSPWMIARPGWTLVLAALLIVGTVTLLSLITLALPSAEFTTHRTLRAASAKQVARSVAHAPGITRLPSDLQPPLGSAAAAYPPGACYPDVGRVTVPECLFGDTHGQRSMVVFGDSHALMWFAALNQIALDHHVRLYVLGKGYCMANTYAPRDPRPQSANIQRICQRFHTFAFHRIRKLHPDYLVLSQSEEAGFSPATWTHALEQTIRAVRSPSSRVIIIGDTPVVNPNPPGCLAVNPDAIQRCSTPLRDLSRPLASAERLAASATGSRYVDVTPWFCSNTCTSVIGHHQVYANALHVTGDYIRHLSGVLDSALALGDPSPSP